MKAKWIVFATVLVLGACAPGPRPSTEALQLSAHNVRAGELYLAGQYVEAINEANAGLAVQADTPYLMEEHYGLRSWIVFSKMELGLLDGLESEVTELIELSDRKKGYISQLGLIYSRQGRAKEAVDVFMIPTGLIPASELPNPLKGVDLAKEFYGDRDSSWSSTPEIDDHVADMVHIVTNLNVVLRENHGSLDAINALRIMHSNGYQSEKTERIIRQQLENGGYTAESLTAALLYIRGQ